MESPSVRPCIVLVEDSHDSRVALTRLLASSGFAVHPAGSLAEALEVVARHGCDLLISDVGLPDGSGLDLVRRLRAEYGLRRAIAMSGFTEAQDVKDCADAGFLSHVAKPIRFEHLLAEVRALLGDGGVHDAAGNNAERQTSAAG